MAESELMRGAAPNQLIDGASSVDVDPIRRVIDRRIPWAIHSEIYSQQSFGAGPSPEQGWKLHVSASPLSAIPVVEAALDVLIAAGARFKVTRSVALLRALNAGEFGLSQIGKFIAVYPSDDDHAVRLAVELDDATRGCPGPRVPSARPLRPGSLVHYRYGAMRLRPEGEVTAASGSYDMLDREGRLTSDVRLGFYVPPTDVVDPFEVAGAHVPPPSRGALLNERYFVIDALSQSVRGGVFRAVDLGAPIARLCLLKEFWHDVAPDDYGRDVREWAANEAFILRRHADDLFMPRFIDSFDVDGDHYIVIEYVEGEPLDRVLEEKYSLTGGRIPSAQLTAIGLATADALARLHARDLVFRDLKPAHVIATPGGDYRLIDFGIAFDFRAAQGPALGAGTPDFCPPEQYAGEPPAPSNDIFAWGAMLHYLACGEASVVDRQLEPGHQRPVRRRPVALINADIPPRIASVIDRAVAWSPADRYPTIVEARIALAEAAAARETLEFGSHARRDSLRERQAEAAAHDPIGRREALRRACEVGDALCAAAQERGGGLCWAASHAMLGKPQRCADLYCGAAGIGLYLAELAETTGEIRYADAARGAARWLAGPVWGRGSAQHGLYGGEPGIAYFFVRLAALLREPGYVSAAELRMRRLRSAPFPTEDLMHGTAGTLFVLLKLFAVTGETAYLVDARAAGDRLARAALPGPNGGCYWDIGSPDRSGTKAPYLGLLHGTAGIALAFAELAAATRAERYLELAKGAAELLLAQASPVPDGEALPSAICGERGLVWPRSLGDKAPGLQAYCHGAGGIAQFLLRLDRVSPDRRYREAAERGALTLAARLDYETLSCVCHGIGGTGHVLLDVHQAFGGPQWLATARQCAARLRCYERAESRGVYSMTRDGAASPDLLLGYAGVGSFLLRLASPETAREPVLR